MPSISTQTTTFLPAVVPVLQRRSLTKRFLTSMMRKHGKDVKQNNTNRAKFQHEFAANKKMFSKIIKDMTLTIRNNMSEAAKSFKDAKKIAKKNAKEAAKESDKADKEQAKKATKKRRKAKKPPEEKGPPGPYALFVKEQMPLLKAKGMDGGKAMAEIGRLWRVKQGKA